MPDHGQEIQDALSENLPQLHNHFNERPNWLPPLLHEIDLWLDDEPLIDQELHVTYVDGEGVQGFRLIRLTERSVLTLDGEYAHELSPRWRRPTLGVASLTTIQTLELESRRNPQGNLIGYATAKFSGILEAVRWPLNPNLLRQDAEKFKTVFATLKSALYSR